MAGMSRMDRREPQVLEARGEMTSAYDWLATGGRRTHSQEVIHFDPRSQITNLKQVSNKSSVSL